VRSSKKLAIARQKKNHYNHYMEQPISSNPHQSVQNDPYQQAVSPRTSPPLQPPVFPNKRIFSQKAQRVIIYTYIAIAILLLSRFLLSLLAANMAAPFVDFIYQLSAPLMLPFINMFGTAPQVGVHRIEFEVLVALLIYALLFFGIAKLISIIFD